MSAAGAEALQRGARLHREGRLAEAIEALRDLGRHSPDLAPAWALLGEALLDAGRTAEAVEPLRVAARLRPGHAGALNNLAFACLHADMAREAEQAAAAALAIDASHQRARATLVHALLRQAAYTRAERELSIVAEAASDAALWVQLANVRLYLGRADEALPALDRAVALAPPALAALESSKLLAMHYPDGIAPEALFEAHRAWAARHAGGEPPRPGRDRAKPRLRVGYVSARMHESSPAGLLAGVLEHHDRARFEAVGYACSPMEDAMTGRLRSACAAWRQVSGLDDERLAALMREDGIDIAVDLAGHTPGNRLGAFARRPAPLAITWLDYFDTTGLPQVDALLSDRWHSPEGDAQRFTERLVRLPGLRFRWEPPAAAPDVAPAGSRDGAPTFGSFNRLAKLSPATVALWCALLRAVPDARLVVKSASLDNAEEHAVLRSRFAREGIDPSRIEPRGASPYAAMLAEYGDIDVALDSFPYNGCIVTLEALWMGRPVLTVRGPSLVSRQSAAILSAIGAEETVAADAADFVARGAALARDRARLRGLSAGLRGRIAASGICDAARFTRGLEAAYRALWEAAGD